jgi:hypothetical protein
MNSFERLLKIYPEAYTDEERAQTFLWYHLRRHPGGKVAHINKIQNYFKKAERKVPSLEMLRSAFANDKRFPPGKKPDTFGVAPEYRQWHEDKFGSCFEEQNFSERFVRSMEKLHKERPWIYWLSIFGSIASILGVLWALFQFLDLLVMKL